MSSEKISPLIVGILTSVISTVLTVALIFAGNAAFAQKTPLVTMASSASSVATDTVPSNSADFSAAFYAPASQMQSCGSQLNSTSLPSSSTYKASDWEAAFRMDSNTNVSLPYEQMIDLNGDGLVDYQYVYTTSGNNSSGGYYTYASCVYLNTGSGFEVAHLCSATMTESDGTITSQNYIGDCAG